MTEPLLNDDEIRDLLKHSAEDQEVSSLWEGEAPAYDLMKSGSKIQDKLREAEGIHKQAAGLMQTALSALCGGGGNVKEGTEPPVTVEFAKHEALNAKDALAQVSLETFIVIPWSNAQKGQEGFILVDKKLFFQMYALLLGGAGVFEKKGTLTRLEKVFLKRILPVFQEALEKSWAGFGAPRFSLQEIMEVQEKLMALPWSFDGFRAFFSVKLKGEPSELQAFFPTDILSVIGSGESSDATGSQSSSKDQQWRDALEEAMVALPVTLTVQLGLVQSELKRILELKAGDELPLFIPETGHDVFFLNRPIFKASMGVTGDSRAIQITQNLKEVAHG